MGITAYLKIGALVILASAIGGAYWYFNWSQNEMAQLRENNTKLETALEQSEAVVASLQDSMRQVQRRFAATNQKFQESRKNTVRLRDALSQHELGYLAENKPGLIENIVNKASKDANRCFEIVSGSPLTDSERNATKPSQINKSCPELANPNFVGEE